MVSDVPAPSASPSVAVSGGCRSSCPHTSGQECVSGGVGLVLLKGHRPSGNLM